MKKPKVVRGYQCIRSGGIDADGVFYSINNMAIERHAYHWQDGHGIAEVEIKFKRWVVKPKGKK